MSGTPKSAASLSSGLLARKGQARPAMRPQGFHGTGISLDDLGWNDMGEEGAPAPVVPISPAGEAAPAAATIPPVLAERETLREGIETPAAAAAEPAPVPLPKAKVARIARAVASTKTKAAFTLRLDADRHLRLRLASASRNRSAQALVVEALDHFLASLPEVESLVSQLSSSPTSKGKS